MSIKLCKDCIFCVPLERIEDVSEEWRCTHKSSRKVRSTSLLTGELVGNSFFKCAHVRSEYSDILADRLDDNTPICGSEGRHYERNWEK